MFWNGLHVSPHEARVEGSQDARSLALAGAQLVPLHCFRASATCSRPPSFMTTIAIRATLGQSGTELYLSHRQAYSKVRICLLPFLFGV